MVFEIDDNNKLELLNSYRNIHDNKLLLTLLYINQNHFQVIYEKGHNTNSKNNKIEYIIDKDKLHNIINEKKFK